MSLYADTTARQPLSPGFVEPCLPTLDRTVSVRPLWVAFPQHPQFRPHPAPTLVEVGIANYRAIAEMLMRVRANELTPRKAQPCGVVNCRRNEKCARTKHD